MKIYYSTNEDFNDQVPTMTPYSERAIQKWKHQANNEAFKNVLCRLAKA